MAKRIVVQPNGNFAIFSEVVDDFIDFDMYKEEVYAFYRLIAIEESKKIAANKIVAAKKNLGRWEEALEIIKEVHGEDRLEYYLEHFEQMQIKPKRWYVIHVNCDRSSYNMARTSHPSGRSFSTIKCMCGASLGGMSWSWLCKSQQSFMARGEHEAIEKAKEKNRKTIG